MCVLGIGVGIEMKEERVIVRGREKGEKACCMDVGTYSGRIREVRKSLTGGNGGRGWCC